MHRYDIGSFCAGTPISISARFAPEIWLDIGSFCANTPIHWFAHTCLSRFIGLAARDAPIWYHIVFLSARDAPISAYRLIGLSAYRLAMRRYLYRLISLRIGSRCADIDIGLSAYQLFGSRRANTISAYWLIDLLLLLRQVDKTQHDVTNGRHEGRIMWKCTYIKQNTISITRMLWYVRPGPF